MPLHLIKLCVGVSEPAELSAYIDMTVENARASGLPPVTSHTTRVLPKRASEILEGGSLFWVMKAKVQARQRILRFEPVRGADGIERCRIVLDPELHLTRTQPRRAFQGWRYLEAADAPQDLGSASDDALPADLERELHALGLL